MKLLTSLLAFWLLVLGHGPVFSADAFYCPMRCEGQKTYAKTGQCPICKMNLEEVPKGDGAGVTRGRDYRVDLSTEGSPKAGQPTPLHLAIRKTADNAPVGDLDEVHEKKFHLIVVAQDLNWFTHVHPEITGPGELKATVTFPSGGNYVLYGDFTPTGAPNQVIPMALKVDGEPRKNVSLVADKKLSRKVGEYMVTLKPSPLKHGDPVTLSYRVTRSGKPVTDLQAYLGAEGHSVILSEDTTKYLHSHPASHHKAHHGTHGNAVTNYGPDVKFTTTFPKPGLYKAWAEFKHQDKVLVADFVLNVR